MIIGAADATGLALLYHLNSGAWGRGGVEFDPNSAPARKAVPDPHPIALENAVPASEVAAVAARRQSCRHYAARAMPLATASTLLYSCYGITELRYETASWARWGRVVPSAGGLYPLEVYVAMRNMEGVPDGVFHYEPIQGCLASLSRCRRDDIEQAMFVPAFTANANMLIMLAGTFATTQSKYGPRGYRYMLIEAGHCAQNLCLVATELGCGSLCLGGFDDDLLNRALGLRVPEEAVLYCIAVGFPDATG
jgi:SagB-type dehydrogenase family enzyme